MSAVIRRRRRPYAVSFTALAVVALIAGPAGAEPIPTDHDIARSKEKVREDAARVGRVSAALAQAGGLLDDLADEAEAAVERYNGERVALERAGEEYRTALQRSTQAAARLAQARDDLAFLAAGAYRGGDGGLPSAADVIGGPGGTGGFLARATTMQVLVNRQHALVEQEKAARTLAELFARQAHDAFAAQREAERSAAAALKAANAAVTRQQQAVREIRQRKDRLVEELGRARARAAELRRERSAAPDRGAVTGRPAGRPAVRGLALGSGRGAVAAAAALKWLGTPYSWGGGGPSGPTKGIRQGAHTVGFDCSGLVTYAWARAGVRLVHYATAQYNAGPHPPRNRLRPGDLVFFAHVPSNPSTIHHVGIYIGDGKMIEAPFTGARVRISPAFRPDYAGATRPVG